jgi:hypothetical protein
MCRLSKLLSPKVPSHLRLLATGVRDDLVPSRVFESVDIYAAVMQMSVGAESKLLYDEIGKIGLQNDNMSAQMVLSKGHGSFKKIKAVAKSYFYISELI